jgi:colicin import membrane protein
MNVRDIPTTAVDSYLKLVRLPLDSAISLLPGNGTGAKPAAKLALDRADATVRAMVAGLLGDATLREDAERRRAAADERERALKLHAEAERTAEKADARLEERQRQASRQRRQAKQRADGKRSDAAGQRERQVRRAAEVRNDRLENSRKTAARTERAVEDRAARDRLQALDAMVEALREREKEVAVRDAAAGLRDAAGRAKADRKSD